MIKFIGSALVGMEGFILVNRRINMNRKPQQLGAESLNETDQLEPVATIQQANGSTPYYQPFIPAQSGGILASLYGDEIYAPITSKGGDLVVNNVTIPNFKVVYDENAARSSLNLNVPRARSESPVLTINPAFETKQMNYTARRVAPPPQQRKGWVF